MVEWSKKKQLESQRVLHALAKTVLNWRHDKKGEPEVCAFEPDRKALGKLVVRARRLTGVQGRGNKNAKA